MCASHPTEPIPAKSMLIKTDKPRPYACATCTRAFARLEHLKRHERSHTKEKPFECPLCERSFARRDLLLRHKQKLHASFSPEQSVPVPAKEPASGTGTGTQSGLPARKRRASIKRESNPATGSVGPGSGSVPGLPPTPHAQHAAMTPAQAPLHAFPQLQRQLYSPTGFNNGVGSGIGNGLGLGLGNGNGNGAGAGNGNGAGIGSSWLPLNPLEHELEPLRYGKTDDSQPNTYQSYLNGTGNSQAAHGFNGNASTRSSRANSFSAASSTSYVPLKDLEKLADSSIGGPSEVGFSTPQAYATEFADTPEYLDLDDAGFVNPQHLQSLQPLNSSSHLTHSSQQAPPPHRRPQGPPSHQMIGEFAVDSPNYMAPATDAGYWNSPMAMPQPPPPAQMVAAPNPGVYRTDPLFKEYVAARGDDFMRSLTNFEDKSLSGMAGSTGWTFDTPPELIESSSSSTNGTSNGSGIDAFFAMFAPHLPFVHQSSVSSSELEHAVAAIGFQVLHENDAALRSYGRAKTALTESSTPAIDLGVTSSSIEMIQAGLLTAAFGLFHASETENAQATDRLRSLCATAPITLALASSPPESASTLEERWRRFIITQSRIRTLFALHAVVSWSHALAPDVGNLSVDLTGVDAPCDEQLWCAQSADEWNAFQAIEDDDTSFDFSQSITQLSAGQPLTAIKVPQFFLQSLLLDLLAQAMMQRHSDRQALGAWEASWSSSPAASLDPRSKFGPLMADCVPLVSLVAMRSVVDLGPLSASLWRRDYAAMNKELDVARHVRSQGLLLAAPYALDVLSWCGKHVRHDLGAVCMPTLIAVANGGFVLTEALAIILARGSPLKDDERELVQRSTVLTDPFPGEKLGTAVLRTAARLVRLSPWPLSGTLAAALEARRS